MYMNGNIGRLKNDKPNYGEARKYFEESNTLDAKNNLQVMYLKGNIGLLKNDKPNYEEARKYFENQYTDC
jgi:tetratricopeptide (TPR) repeat protein